MPQLKKKTLLCLTGFTVIIIIIQNTTGMDHLKIWILNAIHPQNLQLGCEI